MVQTALTKKLSFVEYRDDSFLAKLRHNGDLHAALLNEEDGIRDLTLNEDVLIFLIICRGSSSPILYKQFVEIILLRRRYWLRFLHGASL